MINLKKPRFWDLRKPNIYAYLLYPFTIFVYLLNFFKKKQGIYKTKIKTICIGNIYLGGTGKTTLSIKINNILEKKKNKVLLYKKIL